MTRLCSCPTTLVSAIYPDADEKNDFDVIVADVTAFLIWLRSLSFSVLDSVYA